MMFLGSLQVSGLPKKWPYRNYYSGRRSCSEKFAKYAKPHNTHLKKSKCYSYWAFKLSIYHLPKWLNLILSHNSKGITFLIYSYLVIYFFHASLLNSLIMWSLSSVGSCPRNILCWHHQQTENWYRQHLETIIFFNLSMKVNSCEYDLYFSLSFL